MFLDTTPLLDTGVCYTTNTLSSDILFVCLFVFSFFFSFFLLQQVVWVYYGKMKLSNSFFFFFIPNDVGCQNPFQSVLLHLYLSSYIWACTWDIANTMLHFCEVVVFGWRSLIHRQKQILWYDRSFEKCWFKPDWADRKLQHPMHTSLLYSIRSTPTLKSLM